MKSLGCLFAFSLRHISNLDTGKSDRFKPWGNIKSINIQFYREGIFFDIFLHNQKLLFVP